MSAVVADDIESSPGHIAGIAAVRKAAVRLLPLLGIGYGIAYMDRVNIGFAALQMNADLHFSAAVYGLGGGLFFVSYALLEIPSNLLLVKYGARRWLARIMVTWGVLAMGMMFVKTPMQFYVMRFLLGAAEAGFFPGAVYYVSQWFPPNYRGRAISRFYVALPVSSIVMGALAGLLLNLQGTLGLAGWQWLFLIEGMPAVVMSVVFFALLPDTPAQAPWLTDDERAWVLRNVAPADHSSGVATTLRALRDPRVLKLGIANLCIMSATYAGLLSAPTVLQGVTKWNPTDIGFLVAFAWSFGAIAMVWVGWHSDRRRERYLHTVLSLVILGGGYIGMGMAHSTLSMVTTYTVTVVASTAVQAAFWCIPGDEFVGPLAQVGVAAIGSIGMIGAFLGPYAFGLAREYSGTYEIGLVLAGVLYFIGAAVVLHSRQSARIALNAAVALGAA